MQTVEKASNSCSVDHALGQKEIEQTQGPQDAVSAGELLAVEEGFRWNLFMIKFHSAMREIIRGLSGWREGKLCSTKVVVESEV